MSTSRENRLKASRKHYQTHKEELNNNTKQFRIRRRMWIRSLKKECSVCGEKDPRCLDFHHQDQSSKVGTVGTMTITHSKKNILKEIKKCIIICSNCHRKLHFKEY